MSFVVVHDTDGIFLGQALGLGFWSKLDSVGQDSAVVFNSIQEAEDFLASWEGEIPENIKFVEITPDSECGKYVSKYACLAAGLDMW